MAMENELKVIYVGNDLEYWKGLVHGFKAYPEIAPVFSRLPLDDSFHPPEAFASIHNHHYDIVYVDLSDRPALGLSLSKLLNRNNVTRLKSVVGLHHAKEGNESLLKGVLAGTRLNYIKSVEKEDVVYHPLSLLDASVRPVETYAEGGAMPTFLYKQVLRVGYVAKDRFRVETGAPLTVGEFIELEKHPLESVMPSKRFYVEDFSDSDLYYNQRFSYHLKFTYLDDDFFRQSEGAWLAYKEELKRTGNPVPEKRQRILYPEVDKRRNRLAPVKEDVVEWIDTRKMDQAPKRLKVLVIDETLEIFKEYDGNLDNFKYTINFQTKLTKDFYQIRRTRPHMIVFRYEENGNNEDVLKRVVEEVKKFPGYEPPILVFNTASASDSLRRIYRYEHIAGYQDKIDLEAIKFMSNKLDERFHVTDPDGKIFLKTRDPDSVATVSRSGEIVKFNESEMWFKTAHEIPMWTSLVLDAPLEALITVLPMREGASFQKEREGFVYRALINGVGEKEKARLRRLVNASLGKESSS